MKSKGFNYRLDELILDMQEIYKLLGYPDSVLVFARNGGTEDVSA